MSGYPVHWLIFVVSMVCVVSTLPAADAGMAGNNSAVEALQEALSTGSINSHTLVQHALSKNSQYASLNTFITLDKEGAQKRARELDDLRAQGTILGPLHGIPIVIKDNIHVAGLPNTAGTLAFKDFIPAEDASIIKRLKAAGVIILGKTNMHELAYGITSDNATFGAVGNAHIGDHIAGGSSGGTAVAIATDMVVIGLGTDTGGSSRIPAALNGLVGFRPSMGRYPSDGMTLISNTRDTAGPMARYVRDVALLDSILSQQQASDGQIDLPELRLGVPREYFYSNLQPAVAKQTESLLGALTGAGVTLVEAEVKDIAELNQKIGFPVVLHESRQLLSAYMNRYIPGSTLETLQVSIASPDVKALIENVIADGQQAEYQLAINTYRPQLQAAYHDYFTQHNVDAIIYPTTPLTARPIENSLHSVTLNGSQVPTFTTYIQNTDPSSNAGIPGLTLPLGMDDDALPFGIEIDGPQGSDRKLLAVGAAIERFILNQANENRTY